MMKTKTLPMMGLCFLMVFSIETSAQLEAKGTGNTTATSTFVTKNGDNTETMRVCDDGNVGIGTTAPTQKLEVNGIISSTSGGFKFPDGSMLTTAPTTSYAKVFTVAQTGGDFSSIQLAINACAGAGMTNPYLVRVMAGTYNESIICQAYVDLVGSGKHSCIITGTVNGANNCLIEGFSIRQGIVCNMTAPTILHNVVTRTDAPYAVGIDITGPATPWIQENEVISCNGYGIICNGFGADAWIITNKILANGQGGMRIMNASPTVSNNLIDNNQYYGIYIVGSPGTPSEPTIDDNVISNTSQFSQGIGISISIVAEPRIIANDIYLNGIGIEIDPPAQPSILSNNINYNEEIGIKCYSNGSTKKVVIEGNHIHSNTGITGTNCAGIYIGNCIPLITHNNISQNRRGASTFPDIDYSSCIMPNRPMISLNVFDFISKSGSATATGLYNVTTAGAAITP